MSHCSRGSFHCRLDTWDDKFTCLKQIHAVIELYVNVHTFTHKYTFTLVHVQTQRGLEIGEREGDVVILPKSSTFLVVIITHYLFLLLHMKSLFT